CPGGTPAPDTRDPTFITKAQRSTTQTSRAPGADYGRNSRANPALDRGPKAVGVCGPPPGREGGDRMLRETRPLLFAALPAAALRLSWQVLSPFASGGVWAAVLVIAFHPMHDRLSRKLHARRWAATAVVTLLVAVGVIGPVVVAGIRVVQ